jgi:hypothetical protein
MRTRSLLALVSCLAVVAVLVPSAAHADDTICAGSLTGGPYDNVVVPEGGFCFIQFAIVEGNVKALPDSQLFIVFSEVGKNVIGDKADTVQVTLFSAVHGNIQIKEGGPNTRTAHQEVLICGVDLPNGDILVEKMEIAQGLLVTGGFCEGPNEVKNGNVTIEENEIVTGAPPASGMHIDSNQIANGNLHVFKNFGMGAKDVVGNNVVNGDIQCYENTPPFIGGPNSGHAPNQPPFMMPPLMGDNQCFGTSS